MTQPGMIGNIVPPDAGWIAREFADIKRKLRELEGANPLDASTIRPNGTLTINGTLDITGNTVIGGTLSLPNGIINNAALTTPVVPAVSHVDVAGFTLGISASAILTATVTVPVGFSQALVVAVGMITATNTRGVTDGLSMYVDISSLSVSRSTLITVAAGQQQSATGGSTALLTSLGATFPIKLWANSVGGAWTPGTGMQANLDAMIVFLR